LTALLQITGLPGQTLVVSSGLALFLCLSVCLSVYLSVSLLACLSLCLLLSFMLHCHMKHLLSF